MEGWKTLNDGTRVKMERGEVEAIFDYIEKEDARRANQYPDTVSCLRAFLDAEQRLTAIGWKKHIFDLEDGEELAVIENGSTGIFHAFWQRPYLHYHDCVAQQGKVWIKRIANLTADERAKMDECSASHVEFMEGETKRMQALSKILGGSE